ncbi:ATPase [Pseudomonas phage PIP]|nr:ATPase [Pseudomonas phage PIP]
MRSARNTCIVSWAGIGSLSEFSLWDGRCKIGGIQSRLQKLAGGLVRILGDCNSPQPDGRHSFPDGGASLWQCWYGMILSVPCLPLYWSAPGPVCCRSCKVNLDVCSVWVIRTSVTTCPSSLCGRARFGGSPMGWCARSTGAGRFASVGSDQHLPELLGRAQQCQAVSQDLRQISMRLVRIGIWSTCSMVTRRTSM